MDGLKKNKKKFVLEIFKKTTIRGRKLGKNNWKLVRNVRKLKEKKKINSTYETIKKSNKSKTVKYSVKKQ